MPKEKEGFREQLARLDELFPGKETLKITEVTKATGFCRETLLADRTFPARKLGAAGSRTGGVYMIPKVALARWLA